MLLAVLVIILAGAALELGFEKGAPGANIHNYGDALWWAIVTVTTAGYGDKYPVTAGGRGVAVALTLVGIGLIGALTATVASFFVEQKNDEQKTDLHERLDRIETALNTLNTLLTRSNGSTQHIAQQDEEHAPDPRGVPDVGG